MSQTPQEKAWYFANFEALEKYLNGKANSRIHSIRQAAISRFAEEGFPTTRNEDWKFTDVSVLSKLRFQPVFSPGTAGRDGVQALALERCFPLFEKRILWNRLTFINGRFSKDLSSISSLPQGVKIKSLAEAMREDQDLVERYLAQYARLEENAFTALSAAFLLDGAFVYVPRGTFLQAPIHLVFLSTDLGSEFVSHPRNLIIVEDNGEAAVIESHAGVGENTYFTNAVTEIVLGENAVVEYERVQCESRRAYHVGTTHVQQDRNSNFISSSMSLGGSLVRHNVTAVLNGEGAESTLNGLYLSAGEQHIDNHTTIDHAKPHCTSHELYKGILGGKSRGVFNGKILVRKGAQKTDAKQTNKNLVLSDDASIDTKPQLEIFADDVKCTHGATIGQLDKDALFYLRSRGLGIGPARDILIGAFASDVINRIKIEPLRELMHQMLHQRLDQERQRGEL
jgi:Fe-S cluster assembly protein SufD